MTPEIWLKVQLFGSDVNLIALILAFFCTFMFVGKILDGNWEDFSKLFRFGKASRSPQSEDNNRNKNNDFYSWLLKLVEVSKSSFTHFYVFAVIYSTFGLSLCLMIYQFQFEPPKRFARFLDFFASTTRTSNTSRSAALLTMSLLTIQSYKRLYECAKVNVKSKAKMNILHYIVGFAHYFCAITGFLGEAPGFAKAEIQKADESVSPVQWMMTLTFLIASYQQFKANKTFADLRKSSKSAGYFMPKGGLFEYVSCPHYLCEIIMYLCLSVILGRKHISGVIVAVWVVINQTIAALMSHNYYLEKFKEYPKRRKAIFPYIL